MCRVDKVNKTATVHRDDNSSKDNLKVFRYNAFDFSTLIELMDADYTHKNNGFTCSICLYDELNCHLAAKTLMSVYLDNISIRALVIIILK